MEILIVILLVAIIALLGYLLWQRKTPQDSQVDAHAAAAHARA